MVKIDSELTDMRKAMDKGFKQVNERLDRMEADQPEDIKAILSAIEKNTATMREDIDHLAEAKGRHEMILNRISKQ